MVYLINHAAQDTVTMLEKGLLASIAILATTLTVLTLATAAPPISLPNTAFAQGTEKFFADLSVAEVVPPIDTETKPTGNAEFEAATDGSSIAYTINVTDINAVSASHIHVAEIGQNGDIVATLFKSETPTDQLSGLLSKGNITSANLEGPMAGKQLSDLIDVMRSEAAYVNVHTQQNPDGEIRGQIEPPPGEEKQP
ncbi:MAG: CHRD domain-containing protein [Nitrosopumilus sp.]|nr:CHRD domain-containing protein [Nitrosopumilus sp.]